MISKSWTFFLVSVIYIVVQRLTTITANADLKESFESFQDVDHHQNYPNVLNEANQPMFTYDDSTLYKINWYDQQDFANLNDTANGEEIIMVSEKQEKYHCILPRINSLDEYGMNKTKNDELNPYRLLKPLFIKKLCTYRVENYWTYEICHGKYIRQYHEDPGLKGMVQEYHLGLFDMDDYGKYEKLYDEKREQFIKLPVVSVEDRQLPYIEFNMTDGSHCDLSGKKRFTRVLYVCYEDGKHELYSVKETTTCEYEVIVFSPILCLSPKFKLKTSIENSIDCFALNPDQGKKYPDGFELVEIEKEMQEPKKRAKQISHLDGGGGGHFLEGKTIKIDTFANGKEVHINFITEVDDLDQSLWSSHSHIITKFLEGDYCLTGGSGWWKYEFCYGKTVNQYHEDKGERKSLINLGKWNLQEHIKWIERNPSKKPKEGKTPKQIWHYYSNGDICDRTQKPRTVEVKLKCRNDPSNPDSVAIYLMEPKICDYILGVESPIICDLLSTVDEYGIFQFQKEE